VGNNNPFKVLVRVAQANPHLMPVLIPALREAQFLTSEDQDAFRLVSHCFPKITRAKWAGLTCTEKYAVMKRLAHKALLTKAIRRIEGGPRFLPDLDGKKLRSDLVTIINYVSKQTSFCAG